MKTLAVFFALAVLSRAASLHEAAERGDLSAARELLQLAPLSVTETNKGGDTPLHIAALISRRPNRLGLNPHNLGISAKRIIVRILER